MREIPLSKPISKNAQLLFRAALWSGEAARNAYLQWKTEVDLEFLDDDFSYYLLPKLYLNQQHNNLDSDKTLKKLKGIYRRTWLENQIRIPQLLTILKQFEENKIDFVILSQTPFVLNLLKDSGVFSLDNFDLLIDGKQISEADKILRRNGWLTKQNPATDVNIFYRSQKSAQIILHQNPNYSSLWKTAVEIDFGGATVESLSLNQQILSLCKNDKNELWAFYLYLILAETAIDWKNLIAEAKRQQSCAELLAKLKYLNEFFAVKIPAERLKSLQKEAEKEMSPPGKWQMAREAYQSLQKSYRQKLSDGFSAPSFWGFIKFLREHWQIGSVLFVPWQIGKRLVKSNGKLRE